MSASKGILIILYCIIISFTSGLETLSPEAPSSCMRPLGLEDGSIRDTQIRASSSYQVILVGPDKVDLTLSQEEVPGAPSTL